MAYRASLIFALIIFLASVLLRGCISYQVARYVEGDEVVFVHGQLQEGKTTLGEALALLGAPDNVAKIGLENLLVYERALLYRNRIRVGIPLPLSSVLRGSFDISAYGTLVRYDSLALFFTSDGILRREAFVKGSSRPYLRSLFSDR